MSGIIGKNATRGSGPIGTVTFGISDDSIDSDHYVDGSIDTAHIGDDQVTYAKVQNVSADERILGRVSGADGAIEELTKAQILTFANIEDGSTADQSAAEIKTLLEDGIDSVHYVDGSIDNEHIADNAIDSEHYAAGSIDAEHLAVGKDGALSLNGAPADHTANGPQTNTFNAGYTTVQSDLVYLGSSSTWLEADADAAGTSINLLGIALEVKDDGEALNVALPGSFIQDASVYSFTPGVPLYIRGTLGAITATKPTGSGDIVRTVGYAVHADMIYFNPSSDYVTLA